jgi:hypothetical protein
LIREKLTNANPNVRIVGVIAHRRCGHARETLFAEGFNLVWHDTLYTGQKLTLSVQRLYLLGVRSRLFLAQLTGEKQPSLGRIDVAALVPGIAFGFRELLFGPFAALGSREVQDFASHETHTYVSIRDVVCSKQTTSIEVANYAEPLFTPSAFRSACGSPRIRRCGFQFLRA